MSAVNPDVEMCFARAASGPSIERCFGVKIRTGVSEADCVDEGVGAGSIIFGAVVAPTSSRVRCVCESIWTGALEVDVPVSATRGDTSGEEGRGDASCGDTGRGVVCRGERSDSANNSTLSSRSCWLGASIRAPSVNEARVDEPEGEHTDCIGGEALEPTLSFLFCDPAARLGDDRGGPDGAPDFKDKFVGGATLEVTATLDHAKGDRLVQPGGGVRSLKLDLLERQASSLAS